MSREGFRARALHEARRYGDDPLVFVRELIQNARDAGAGAVSFRVGGQGGLDTLSCRDDGDGMSFEHARRYLFSLYASSKEGRAGAAGRFGVGFWSILRFEPSRIVVRSWPRSGDSWEVELDGSLSAIQRRTPSGAAGPGTEVLLERPGRDGGLEGRIAEAAWQSARFVGRRAAPDRPLAIRVNGRLQNAAFQLPPPSVSFRRGGLRGAVGLGSEARVELFAQGLKVRSAGSLEDLLAPAGRGSGSAASPASRGADGLAPQALLDGQQLEVLLARGDARDTPALDRLVRLAQSELAHLVDQQLAAVRPGGWRGLVDAARRLASNPAVWALAVALAAFVAGAVWGGRRAAWTTARPASTVAPAPAPASATGTSTATVRVSPSLEPIPYRDLAAGYRGPEVDAVGGARDAYAIRYAPATARPLFAALLVEHPGRAIDPVTPLGLYPTVPCAEECLMVEVALASSPGPLRVPVPTGQRVTTQGVTLDDRPLRLQASPAGEAVVWLEGASEGLLRYHTSAALDASHRPFEAADLPDALQERARRRRGLPLGARVAALTADVQGLVSYSNEPAVVARDRELQQRGLPFVARALATGAGDCDVQNGLLALLLSEARVPSRLAIGFVGLEGAAVPGVHAWVEYLDEGGRWQVADASRSDTAPPGAPLVPPPVAVAASPPSVRARVPVTASRSWLLTLLVPLPLLVLGLLLLRRTRRRIRLDPGHHPAQLLRSALQRPEAFAHIPAVFDRRLVPCLRGSALSLGEAWERASRGRLFASRSRSPLAVRSSAQTPVLDGASEEGGLAADALGAVDLDAWDALLERSRSAPLLEAASRHLRRQGEPYALRVASGAGGESLLDLPARGALGPGVRGTRVIVLDAADPAWLRANALRERRPRQALFDLLDALADRLRLPDARRARLLAPLAAEALAEAAR
jgi:transglutaminase-like putative cysteine protease